MMPWGMFPFFWVFNDEHQELEVTKLLRAKTFFILNYLFCLFSSAWYFHCCVVPLLTTDCSFWRDTPNYSLTYWYKDIEMHTYMTIHLRMVEVVLDQNSWYSPFLCNSVFIQENAVFTPFFNLKAWLHTLFTIAFHWFFIWTNVMKCIEYKISVSYHKVKLIDVRTKNILRLF